MFCDLFALFLSPALNRPVSPVRQHLFEQMQHVDGSLQAPNSLLPAAVDALQAKAVVANAASLAISITYVDNIAALFAAVPLAVVRCPHTSCTLPPCPSSIATGSMNVCVSARCTPLTGTEGSTRSLPRQPHPVTSPGISRLLWAMVQASNSSSVHGSARSSMRQRICGTGSCL